MILSRALFASLVLAGSFVFAAAPSLVEDYDLQLEKPHDGYFVPLADGNVLSIEIDRIDGEVISNICKLDGSGNVIAEFSGYQGFSSQSPLALNFPRGKTLIQGSPFDDQVLKMWQADGTLDSNFTLPFDENPSIRGIARANDDKFFVWGRFSIGGESSNLVRLLPDGNLDGAFVLPISGTLNKVILDGPSHLFLVGKLSVNSSSFSSIHRMSLDGTLDPSFVISDFPARVSDLQRLPNGDLLYSSSDGVGRSTPNGSPSPAAAPPLPNHSGFKFMESLDGSIFVTGIFDTDGTAQKGVVKLTPEGTLDPSFQLPPAIDFQPLADGSALVNGTFSSFQDVPRYGVARVDSSGNLLPGFDQRFSDDGSVISFDRFSDDSILVNGDFNRVISGGEIFNHRNITKLTPEGLPDENFSPPFSGEYTTDAKVLSDDRILIGFDDESRRWERFFPDGTPDPSLPAEVAATYAQGRPSGLSVLEDGTISFLTGGGPNQSERVLIKSDDSLLTTEGFSSNSRFFSLVTLPAGVSYYLNDFGGSTIFAISRSGALSTDSFQIPRTGSYILQNYAFSVLPGRNFLIAGEVSPRVNTLRLFDYNLTPSSSFVGRELNGVVTETWAFPENGQIFISGNFTEYDGVSRSNFAQVRMDGSIEAGFDLGTGASATTLIQLRNGDLLMGNSIRTLLVDGQNLGGIAKVRPVTQTVESIPAPPSQVSTAASSPSSVGLAWASPPRALGILIERQLSPDGPWELLAKVGPEITTRQEMVTPGSTYNFRITAYNLTGESSTTIAVTTPQAQELGGSLADMRIDLLDYARIDSIHRLESGKYLVAGDLDLADDQNLEEGHNSLIVRLNTDGSYDDTFKDFGSLSRFSTFRTIEELPDGKILLGTSNSSTSSLYRLFPDGTPDPNFQPTALSRDINVVRSLSNGNILIAGRFNNIEISNDQSRRVNYLLILDQDGQIIEAPPAAFNAIDTATDLPSGGFLLAGSTGTNHDLIRINADGSHDESFILQGHFEGSSGEIRGIHQCRWLH